MMKSARATIALDTASNLLAWCKADQGAECILRVARLLPQKMSLFNCAASRENVGDV